VSEQLERSHTVCLPGSTGTKSHWHLLAFFHVMVTGRRGDVGPETITDSSACSLASPFRTSMLKLFCKQTLQLKFNKTLK